MISIAALCRLSASSPRTAGRRLSFIVALRACAALIILWHHFALYPPLREWAAPLIGGLLDWIEHHARATQVFFVVGGYVMARSMSAREWTLARISCFTVQRYFRLGIPYLATIAVILPVYLFARGWVPDDVVGSPVSLPQFLAHLFFLQDLLGYEALSAGLWFVCINFQLALVYAATLWLRDQFGGGSTDYVGLLGWPLAILSLFYVNLNPAWESWWLYFFPYFFLGIVIHRTLYGGRTQLEFWAFQILIIIALFYEWRWRLGIALFVGFLLFAAEKFEFGAYWPRNRVIAKLGQVSYSLFLIHFPVLVAVSALWARLGWTTPAAAVAGLLAAFLLSIATAFAFYRWVEVPASHLMRRPENSPAGLKAERPVP
ncbi:MAG: acyltransferase [Rhodocyclaceae bacterium]|nr:acyltransferase [Rhodocyclaceae bacterium]MDZ4216459.1 acyltransferase [Rhodocyclaceae bacterium]